MTYPIKEGYLFKPVVDTSCSVATLEKVITALENFKKEIETIEKPEPDIKREFEELGPNLVQYTWPMAFVCDTSGIISHVEEIIHITREAISVLKGLTFNAIQRNMSDRSKYM